MGVYTLVFFGGTPIGAPVIGWAAEAFGPRSGLIGGGVLTAFFSALAGAVYLRRRRSRDAGVPQATEHGAAADEVLTTSAPPPTTPI